MNLKRFVLLSAVVSLVAPKAWADFTARSQTVAIFGGATGSSTQYDYEPGSRRPVSGGGAGFGAQYLHYVSGAPAIAVGVDVSNYWNGDRRSHHTLDGFDSTARVKSFVGMAIARLAFPRGLWRPYLFAGVGGHHSSQQLSAAPSTGRSWAGGGTESRMLVDRHKMSTAIGYGIGLDIFPSERFFFGTELRGVRLFGLNTDDTATLRAAGFHDDEREGVVQGAVFARLGFTF